MKTQDNQDILDYSAVNIPIELKRVGARLRDSGIVQENIAQMSYILQNRIEEGKKYKKVANKYKLIQPGIMTNSLFWGLNQISFISDNHFEISCGFIKLSKSTTSFAPFPEPVEAIKAAVTMIATSLSLFHEFFPLPSTSLIASIDLEKQLTHLQLQPEKYLIPDVKIVQAETKTIIIETEKNVQLHQKYSSSTIDLASMKKLILGQNFKATERQITLKDISSLIPHPLDLHAMFDNFYKLWGNAIKIDDGSIEKSRSYLMSLYLQIALPEILFKTLKLKRVNIYAARSQNYLANLANLLLNIKHSTKRFLVIPEFLIVSNYESTQKTEVSSILDYFVLYMPYSDILNFQSEQLNSNSNSNYKGFAIEMKTTEKFSDIQSIIQVFSQADAINQQLNSKANIILTDGRSYNLVTLTKNQQNEKHFFSSEKTILPNTDIYESFLHFYLLVVMNIDSDSDKTVNIEINANIGADIEQMGETSFHRLLKDINKQQNKKANQYETTTEERDKDLKNELGLKLKTSKKVKK